MSDLISRSSIYNYIKAQINPYGKPFKGTAYEFGLKVMDYIENATPVEAVPVVYGKWIAQNEGLTRFRCSHCESENHEGFETYCPKCGADMRKKVE